MAEQDITKTGPVGLKGLKGINVQKKENTPNSEAVKMRYWRGQTGAWTASSPALWESQHRDINDPLAEWGASRYDTIVSGMGGVDNLNESRYENQSTADAMGNAIAKMLGTAATTLVSSIGGAIAGIPTAISEGRWSGLWDNDLTQALSDVDKYMEENFKIYQSKEQQNADWLSTANLTSASFWGDDVIKNAGFMLGAAASGSLFTGGLGLASRALGLAGKASRASKITTGILGSMFSAAGEGAIEAKHTMEDLIQLNTQRLDDELNRQAQLYAEEYYRTEDGALFQSRMEDLQRKRELGIQQIQQDARSAGNWDMALNIPILTLSNFITLGKGFSKSFANARKLAESANRAEGANMIGGLKNIKNKAKEYFDKAAKGVKGEGLETTVKAGKGRMAFEFVKPILTEGSEEMNQQWASSFSGHYKGNREDINDYWRAKMDPGSEQDAISAWTAIGKGFYDSWGDYDQWEQFFVGGLTGAVGMPMPTKAFNQDKTKKKFDPRRYFSWEGGSFQSLKEFKNKLNSTTQASEELNKRINDPNFWNRLRSGVAHSYFQTNMNNAVADDDIKSYKDAEEKQFVQDLEAFVKAGKVNDFRTLINAATQDLSDGDIQDLIKRNTVVVSKEQDAENKRKAIASRLNALQDILERERESMGDTERNEYVNIISQLTQDYDSVTGEEQYISLYTDNHGNLTKSFDDIRSGLQRNREKLNKRVDDYLQSINVVNKLSEGKLTSDQEGHLAYLHYMGNAARNRALDIVSKYDFSDKEYIVLNTEETPEQVTKKIGLPVERLDNNHIGIRIADMPGWQKRELFLDLGLGFNLNTAKENAKDLAITSVNPITAIQNLADATKLISDSREFQSIFTEYMNNPSIVEEDKSKAEKQNEEEIVNSKIDDLNTSDVVEAIDSGELGINLDDFNFDESDREILNGDKQDASEEDKARAARNKKVDDAKNIINTRERAKEKARILTDNDEQFNEIERVLDEASKASETPDELLDLDTEIFNNPDALETNDEERQIAQMLQDEGKSLEEINQAITESKQQRLNEIKGILEVIKDDINDENAELASMPKPDITGGKTVRELGDTESIDPTGKAEEVNPEPVKKGEKKEADPITPNLSDLTILNNSTPRTESNEEKGYWKSNTTEFPIHRTVEDNNPYYTKVADPKKKAVYKAIYDYLSKVGAFARVNNNEVKRGQKVGFAVSKSLLRDLNKVNGSPVPVVLLVDENGNVIGDLANPFDSSVFNSFPGLSDLYTKVFEHFNKHANDTTDDLVIIPGLESTVSRNYIGRPKYSANNVRHTLNEIANGKPFKLGLALTSSPNPNMVMEPGRRQSQGKTDEEMAIIAPQDAKAGQPYLLIQTSDERRKWMPVPISMPTFGEKSARSKLYNKVLTHLGRLQDAETLKDTDSILNWTDKLKELLAVADIYLEKTKDGVLLRIKKLSTDTSWETIHRGPLNIEAIVSNLALQNIPFQISRKYINDTFEGESYNEMIGEIANTNLEIGALHSVNDFFTINPIVEGKQQKAKPIPDSPRKSAEEVAHNRAVDFIEKSVLPKQANVDRTKTDPDYYYIKESDGKYHKYERVHRLLPSNFSGTSKHGNRGLNTGNAVDTIVRNYLSGREVTKPDIMSDEAYNSLLAYLKGFKKVLDSQGFKVYSDNVVLYHKYPDGRRIAGEVDLLLVDSKGFYHIFDMKTSAYSFYAPTFSEINSNWGQVMSTKDFYTLQQSSYAKLFNDEFGKQISTVSLMPFVVTYNTANDQFVTALTHEKNMGLPLRDPTVYFNQAITESGTSAEDDFFAAIGAMEESQTKKPTESKPVQETKKEEPARSNISDKSSELLKDAKVITEAKILINSKLRPASDGQYIIAELNGQTIFVPKDSEKTRIVKNKEDMLDKVADTVGDSDANNIATETPGVVTKDSNGDYSVTIKLKGYRIYGPLAQEKIDKYIKPSVKSEPEKLSKEDALTKIKDTKLFNTPNRKALLNKLSDDTLSELANVKKVILTQRMNKIDAFIKPNMSNEEVDSLVRKQLGLAQNRSKTNEVQSSDISSEIKKVRRMLPQLSREDAIRIVDSIIKTHDGYAWGQFKNGTITLYRGAARGTAYHEAFHYVFNSLMNDSEIEEAYNSARKQFGDLSTIELEERMAEDFREYMQNEETFTGRLKNLWRNIKNILNKLRGNWSYLDNLYSNIARGKYSNREALEAGNIRNLNVTRESVQSRVDSIVNNNNVNKTRKAKNNAWGKLVDSMKSQGLIMKGYYDRGKSKYVVTSVTEAPRYREANLIRQYHSDKLEYRNITEEQREYLKERGISTQSYENMTIEEKEVLFECMY